MGKVIKNTDKIAINTAIDMLARNPGTKYRDIGEKLGVSTTTIGNWLSSPSVIDRLYKRYMEVAGTELPAVVQAVIEEAKLGNVHAARLVLEHFGKLENKIKIQVESNFEKFMKGGDAEEIDFFEVTKDQENVLDNISNKDIQLPERHPSNNEPKVRDAFEKDRLKYKIKKAKTSETEAKKQSDRYKIRARAKKVGLELLSPGRHSRSERNAWMKKLEELEKENS
tara:strand:- start:163 stop:837 length:675 start_codon:yes stop_codon:yes gene_type:complete